MIRRPPRSTQSRSSAASDVYKRQLHPLATDESADLRDVQQTVATRAERDERTEGRRLHDGTDEALADLWHVRVGDRVDHLTRSLGRRAVGGADVDGAVILDRDVGARLSLDLVDHLALRADDLADLVDRDLHRDDARRIRAHLVGRVDGLVDDVEDRETRLLRLRQRAGEDGGGDAVELR